MSAGGDVWALPQQPVRLQRPVWRLQLRGPDALRVLHGQTTQALLDAQPGERRPTCWVTATARLRALADVEVHSEGADLLVSAGDGQQVHQGLDRVLFPADQVSLSPLELLQWHALVDPAGPAGGAGWGLPGRQWLLPEAAPLPPELEAVPLEDSELHNWLRLRQGIPAADAELSEAFNPLELGLRDRLSFDKGCYLGQETLAKLHANDGVKQQLRRFHAPEGVEPPAPGTQLVDARGERAALVTSLQGRCGLLLLRRRCWDQSELAGLQLSLPAAAVFDSH